jgi:nucleolar protein 56
LPDGTVHSFPRAPLREELPRGLVEAVSRLEGEVRLIAAEPVLAAEITRVVGRQTLEPTRDEFRSARARLPVPEASAERAYILTVARQALERALRAPDEILITLAREEERVERALGREERAAEAFVPIPHSPIEEYSLAWEGARAALARHHEALRATVEAEARSVLPNLSSLVGPRVAARLLAAAGGLPALGRMRAPRLQLLGSRRRPSADRGPRYGLLYRAERMEEVPLGRRGAYARSLAALASIAARADALTGADISAPLLARRDRRVDDLRKRRR